MVDNEIVVQAMGLKKIYKDFWGRTKAIGVDGIDLSVHRGEVVGLLGPNGSGKTTTIKLILGLLRPLSGTIRVFGKNPQNNRIKRRIGYLPEDTYLYHYLTAEETLGYFGSLFRLSSKELEKRIKQLLEMVDLAHAAKRRLGEFSKGMARRIGLAQALINDPDLVILDEPTAGLDPIGCRDIKNLIRHLAGRNKTVIISSHLLADLEDVCDTALVIHKGKIRAQGSLRTLLTAKNKIRVTLPSSDSRLVNKIAEMCKPSTPNEVIIDQPSMRLEEFFLQVIHQDKQPKRNNSEFSTENRLAPYLVDQCKESRSSERTLNERNMRAADFYQNNTEAVAKESESALVPDLERLKSLTKKDCSNVDQRRQS